MLGKLVRELPAGDVLYEPKWDGFRALTRREGGEIAIRSRHGNPLARYFPELAAELLELRRRSSSSTARSSPTAATSPR